MTTNNDTGSSEVGGKERPQVTLDLKATEVQPETPPAPDEDAAAAHDQRSPEPQGAGEREAAAPVTASGKGGDNAIQSFATHMAAGVLGALVALVLAYYLAGSFRERLPLLTDRSAEDLLARIARYDERFAALEKGAAPDASAAQLQALAGQLEAAKREIAALGKQIDERPVASAGATTEALAQSIDPLKAQLAGLEPLKAKAAELDALKARVAEMETRLGAVAQAQTEVETDSKASALAVALYALRRAAAEGKPYDAELKAIADISPVPLDLAPLEARGKQGVRNLAQLQASFEAAADKAIDAEDRPADSLGSRIWAKAKSLVRVRRTGDVEGDGTQAVLARTEVRLNTGDLRAAVREGEQLKGPAAAAFAPWLDEARARLAADEALARAEAALLTALGDRNRVKGGS